MTQDAQRQSRAEPRTAGVMPYELRANTAVGKSGFAFAEHDFKCQLVGIVFNNPGSDHAPTSLRDE
ncbi:hypothetical protein [Roseibium sp.]|uniref:hypothetical protein n=1 Tax=Roseibium sp. TaxID=1936156 RepID=UPI003B51D48E